MKTKNIFQLNQIVKKTLTLVLASSISIPALTITANAEETTPSIDDQTIVNPSTNEEVISLDEILSDGQTEEEVQPSLVPGDFFYFAKIAFEKMQLLLTTDEVKEAKLLADFASERLLEASALFQEGNEEGATEAIKAALATLSNVEQTGAISLEDVDLAESESDVSLPEEETAMTKDNEQVDETVEEPSSQEQTEAIEQEVSQNIVALTLAMEKVKNPKAKAALQKNIDKSYAKLAKKMAKIEKKANKIAEAEELQTTEDVKLTVEETNGDVGAIQNSTETTEPVNATDSAAPVVVEQEQTVVQTQPVVQATKVEPTQEPSKREQKQIVKEQKQAAKEEKHKEKEQEKMNKKNEK